jgi:hypothetical protein
MKFLEKLLKVFTDGGEKYNLGVVFHPSNDDIASFEEIVAKANPVEWKPLETSKLPQYGVRAQNGSSGCVAFSMSLMASILYYKRRGRWLDFSPSWTYSKRVNKPGEGMIATDVFNLAANSGFLFDDILPSDNLGEYELSNPITEPWFKKLAETFKLENNVPIRIPIGDIETLASVIQTTGKPVMVWFRFGSGEWGKVPTLSASTTPFVHSVVAIPPSKDGEMTFGMYKGEKAIVIQDSWGDIAGTIGGKRIITESFFKARNLFGAYTMGFKFDGKDKPKYDGSVKSLQDCLKFEGLFPSNVESTGFMGNITRNALKKFQEKYGIEQTGTVGPITRSKLEELYS